MRANEYQEMTRRTRPVREKKAMYYEWEQDLLQGCVGMASEAGEVTGLLEKFAFQGHELDYEKFKKELGDVLWYAAMVMDALDLTFEEVMEANIAKLKVRYPEKFSAKDSVERRDVTNG